MWYRTALILMAALVGVSAGVLVLSSDLTEHGAVLSYLLGLLIVISVLASMLRYERRRLE